MVGERLAEIRKDHDDTQAALAKKLNVSVTTVRSWEQEKSSPSHDALVAICRLYRISADYLLGLSEVDPAYDPRGNQQRFTDDEWAALREYEEFLLWKRRKKSKQYKGQPRYEPRLSFSLIAPVFLFYPQFFLSSPSAAYSAAFPLVCNALPAR